MLLMLPLPYWLAVIPLQGWPLDCIIWIRAHSDVLNDKEIAQSARIMSPNPLEDQHCSFGRLEDVFLVRSSSCIVSEATVMPLAIPERVFMQVKLKRRSNSWDMCRRGMEIRRS
jgi:hypothetical protein